MTALEEGTRPTPKGSSDRPEVVTGRNPATGEVCSILPAAGPKDLERAVERARIALPRWSGRGFEERCGVLWRFAELVEEHLGELVRSIVTEVGKPITEAEAEVAWTATSARFYAEHPPLPERAGGALVHFRPIGVVAAITPWNVPLLTPAWKWLPALVAGNTVVWKPSERASGVAARAIDLLVSAGLPPDVLVPIFGGPQCALGLAGHPGVDAVHFTGSTNAGRALAQAAAASPKAVALELGGLNPAIVLGDADIEQAAADIMASAAAISGQKCSATRQVLMDRSIADELRAQLRQTIAAFAPADPTQRSTRVGPLIGPDAAERARAAVQAALGRGGRIVTEAPPLAPGSPLDPSSFFAPVVLEGLGPFDPLRREELFAPVLTLVEVDGPDEAIELANALPFGLAASVFTSDPHAQERIASALDFGIVGVNRRCDSVDLEAPFCGRRLSGNGLPEGGTFVYSSLTTPAALYGLPVPSDGPKARPSAEAHPALNPLH